MPDWNPEFPSARIAREAHFSHCAPTVSCPLFFFLSPFFLRFFSFFYTLPLTDQRLSQGNHQLLKASRGGDSGPRYGLLQRFIACVLGFDAARSGCVAHSLARSLGSAAQLTLIFCPDCLVPLREGKKKGGKALIRNHGCCTNPAS